MGGLLGYRSAGLMVGVPVSCFTQQDSLAYLDVNVFRRTILGILNDSPLSFFLILGTTDKASSIGLQNQRLAKPKREHQEEGYSFHGAQL